MTSVKGDHVRPQLTRIQFSKRGITLYSNLGFERRLEGESAERFAGWIQPWLDLLDDTEAIENRVDEPSEPLGPAGNEPGTEEK